MTPTELEKLAELRWCDSCYGPVTPMALWERWLSWACYWLVMVWPYRWFANRAHLMILPWAGNIAFRCHCRAQAEGK